MSQRRGRRGRGGYGAGSGPRGKGKRKFAPQGSWRQYSDVYQDDGGAWISALRRPHAVPFPAPGPLPATGPGKKPATLVERAQELWGSESTYDANVITGIFQKMKKSNFSYRVVMALEFSQYLEKYLWCHFTPERVSPEYLMSIVLMVIEKWRQGISSWQAFVQRPEGFPELMHVVMDACTASFKDGGYSMKEHTLLLIFLDHAFNSLEVDVVREQIQKLVSMPIWENLHSSRLEQELSAVPKLKKYWNIIRKRDKSLDDEAKAKVKKERGFLWHLMQQFYIALESVPAAGPVDEDTVSYCERFLELLTDLVAQLPTRRFFNTLMDSSHLVFRCSLSPLVQREPEGHLFKQLLDRLKFYTGFEINDQTGSFLTDHEMTDIHYNKITSLQRAAFKLFPDLRSFAMSNVASVDTGASLRKHFSALSQQTLHDIALHLHLVPEEEEPLVSQLLLEVLVGQHERRLSQLEAINTMPLYPTEDILWDVNIVPSEYYNGETCLALPKLNLQFLTLHDYLLRNYELFRLESTYEIREDIEDVVSRLKPWMNTEGVTEFSGWARMALPVSSFSVVEVGAPNVGENRPSRVRADVAVELNMTDTIKREWEGLRKHDVCFLISIHAKMALRDQFDWTQPFVSQVGLECVRGCEVEGMLDEQGHVIEEGPEPKPQFTESSRTYRVWLDTNQYQKDMAQLVQGEEDVYESFNIFMRRKPKENNFKAVLETIRDLMNAECVVPDWLHDVFLGYGDPGAANYKDMPNCATRLNFNDTFLSYAHLVDSFPNYQVKCSVADVSKQVPPFKLVFPAATHVGQKRKRGGGREGDEEGEEPEDEKPCLIVEPYSIPNRGPYPFNQPKKNTVPFTPTQVEAIVSGLQPGLTLVVGPPGTGKTDVAVQIISNLYHNYPDQRTLLVTHSNQALNQLFEKIMALDIDERHLLRLGHGEEELATDKDFSRYGRVNFILALRQELLKEVERLQNSLGVSGDVSYTCETAAFFFLYQVSPRWDDYLTKIRGLANKEEEVSKLAELFPFTNYFSTAPQPLFKGRSYAEDLDIAEGCFRHIKKVFKQLEGFRAFELLRSGRDRINYLMVREAKIVAMTCTHAALKRRDMVDLAFKYDNVLMEEAAQILEVETFIPLMLQNPQDGHNRLKRVILIGDHHQLPPVIKNMSFQKYSNMEQSMFSRFVRLGVPTIQLDAQGRARPSLCQLYKWRYKTLGDLPHVMSWPDYRVANPGMLYDYQLVDVGDFNGVGETEPTPHFIQNLGEAEYAVAIFMYMRLQGYPPDKIAILTTYNGQKHLIRDVLAKRCARNPVFGLPEKVTTVDRYQGQQNDYIILSLVRTKTVGHLRDVRRLVVAMSRARLGLYVLARVSLFQTCTELQPTFNLLLQQPLQLHLIPDEPYPAVRKIGEGVDGSRVFVVGEMSQLADYVYRDYQARIEALHSRAQYEQRARDEDSIDTIAAPPSADGAQPTEDMVEQETTPTKTQPTGMSDTTGDVEQEATPTGGQPTTDTTDGSTEMEQEVTPTAQPTTDTAEMEQEATPTAQPTTDIAEMEQEAMPTAQPTTDTTEMEAMPTGNNQPLGTPMDADKPVTTHADVDEPVTTHTDVDQPVPVETAPESAGTE